MKQNELRLYNFVYSVHNGLAQIIEFFGDYVYLSNKNGSPFNTKVKLNEITPIRITDKYIERFKVEKWKEKYNDMNGYEVYKNQYGDCHYILVGEDSIKYFVYDKQMQSEVCIKILKEVHELQNLYFALTGEELELK